MYNSNKKFALFLFLIFTVSIVSLNFIIQSFQADAINNKDQELENIEFHLYAKRYEFTPNKLKVNFGTNVTIILHATDRIHGFYLEGYDITQTMCNEHDFSISFITKKVGTFIFKCNEPACGPYHPYMIGSLTVSPNNQFNFQLFVLFSSFIAINIYFYLIRRRDNIIQK